MANDVRTYSPDKVVVLVGGVPMQGYAEDTFFEIAPMSDLVTSQAGADGEIARSLNTDRRGEATITLQQTSPSNDVLSGLATLDGLTAGGVFPVMVQDLMGRTLAVSSQAWISRLPNVTFGREVADREWKITGVFSVYTIGGSL